MIMQKKPDIKKAFSLIESSRKDMEYTLTLSLSKASANTIIRNVYECFRMLGEALLTAKGIKSEDHVVPISELIKLKISAARPISILDNLRRTRRNINYYGYSTTLEEAKDTIDFAKSCFEPALREVKRQIEELSKVQKTVEGEEVNG